jgi:hypothetical protein
VLRITRSANGEVIFRLSGRIENEHIEELKTLIGAEANHRPVAFDLQDVILAGPEAIAFLQQCEAQEITLLNCPPYIRAWITRRRADGSASRE